MPSVRGAPSGGRAVSRTLGDNPATMDTNYRSESSTTDSPNATGSRPTQVVVAAILAAMSYLVLALDALIRINYSRLLSGSVASPYPVPALLALLYTATVLGILGGRKFARVLVLLTMLTAIAPIYAAFLNRATVALIYVLVICAPIALLTICAFLLSTAPGAHWFKRHDAKVVA